MAAIHEEQVCAAFNEGLQALGGGLSPHAPLNALGRGLCYHVPGRERGSQDGNEREDAHVPEGWDERRCQPDTAKQESIVPAGANVDLSYILPTGEWKAQA